MSVAVLATFLSAKGFRVRAFDNILHLPWSRQRFLEALDSRPLAVGISTSMLCLPESVRTITDWARERCPEARVVLGGVSAESDPEVRDMADVVVFGAGERSLELLLRALKTDAPLDDVPNLMFRKHGQWVRTRSQANVPIEAIPPTDWSLLDSRASLCYSIESSRGCPHSCAFCCYRDRMDESFRSAPVIVEEMRRDQERFGARVLRFVDNNLTSSPERVEALCGAILDARLDIPWCGFARIADFASCPRLARRMREAGCFSIQSGIESGSDAILRNMRKGYTPAQIREGVARLREAGIQAHGMFIVGFPGETRETVETTLSLIQETELDSAAFFTFELCDGTDADVVVSKAAYGIEGSRLRWRHATMDSEEALAMTRHCVDAVCMRMSRTCIGSEMTMSYLLIGGGLSLEEAGGYLQAVKDHYRAKKLEDPLLERQAVGRILDYYSKMRQTLRDLKIPFDWPRPGDGDA
jgi:radical SAM superfamily enzyme YgiQ (UPF0313 family)